MLSEQAELAINCIDKDVRGIQTKEGTIIRFRSAHDFLEALSEEENVQLGHTHRRHPDSMFFLRPNLVKLAEEIALERQKSYK